MKKKYETIVSTIETTEIGEVVTGDTGILKVSFIKYEGSPRIDFRSFYKHSRGDTDWLPTKKGFFVNAEAARQLSALLIEAAEVMEEKAPVKKNYRLNKYKKAKE